MISSIQDLGTVLDAIEPDTFSVITRTVMSEDCSRCHWIASATALKIFRADRSPNGNIGSKSSTLPMIVQQGGGPGCGLGPGDMLPQYLCSNQYEKGLMQNKLDKLNV